MKKEYAIEVYDTKDNCFGMFSNLTYTEFEEVSARHAKLSMDYPNEKFRIVCREIPEWEVCFI